MNTTAPYPLHVWRQVGRYFVAWHDRARARIELKGLTDSTLQDIGLWRDDERMNPGKLFWTP